MPTLIETTGHYARKQLDCPNPLIAWSHRSRFEMARRLCRPLLRAAGGIARARLLDYGCGDATFLTLMADQVSLAAGTDLDAPQLRDCQARLAGPASLLKFFSPAELAAGQHTAAYHVVTCMEVLEHCLPSAVDRVVSDLVRLTAPGGWVVISVPVETGVPFLAKWLLRSWAAQRGAAGYDTYETYAWPQALAMVFAEAGTALNRPVYSNAEMDYHSHYGFNWRALRRRLARHLRFLPPRFSPLDLGGDWLASQVWLVGQPRR